VAHLPRGEYALRDHRGRERRTRRHCVGARLSAPTGPADVARASPDVHIGFFLHIPFPRANCSCNCRGDVRSWPDSSAPISWDSSCTPRLQFLTPGPSIDVGDGYRLGTRFEGRAIRVGSFPISVDCDQIVELAADPNVRARAREIREASAIPSSCYSASTDSTTPREYSSASKPSPRCSTTTSQRRATGDDSDRGSEP